MSGHVERLWNDMDRGKPKEVLLKCPFVHHKTQMDFPGFEVGAQQLDTGNWN